MWQLWPTSCISIQTHSPQLTRPLFPAGSCYTLAECLACKITIINYYELTRHASNELYYYGTPWFYKHVHIQRITVHGIFFDMVMMTSIKYHEYGLPGYNYNNVMLSGWAIIVNLHSLPPFADSELLLWGCTSGVQSSSSPTTSDIWFAIIMIN